MPVLKTIIPREVINHGKVRWRVICPKALRQGGKHCYFFEVEPAAIAKAAEFTKDLDRVGAGFHSLTQQGQALVLEALKRAGSPEVLLKAVDRLSAADKATSPKLVSDVVTEWLSSKTTSGARVKSVQNARSAIKKFAGSIEVVLIGDVTTEIIEQWLSGNGWSASSRKTYLGHVAGLFFFAMKRGYIARNPALGVGRPKLDDKPPGIHTPDQVKAFLDAVLKHDRALIGYVAMVYFGGLRPEESRRLTKADVRADLVEVTPAKSKTRRRRFVPINETLKAWLGVKKAKVGGTNIRKRWEAVRRTLTAKNGKKFPWPHDVMRHSFCSYALPKFGAKDTAAWAGHSESVLYAHYRERVRPEDVEKFWALRP